MTAGRSRGAILRFAVVFLIVLVGDLVLKQQAFERVAGTPVALERGPDGTLPPIPAHDAVIVVPKVLALQLTLNRGAVFGLGQGGRWVFVFFSVVAVGVVVTIFTRSRANAIVLHLALAAVLAGALGNLYDRLAVGAVRDMLLLFPGVRLPFGWTWPGGADGLYPWIFNLADVGLVIGLGVLVILSSRSERAETRPAEPDA